MTNEEAIERIKSHKFWLKINDPRATSILVALDMATRSLMREKTGRWIKHDIDGGGYYDCSRCACVAPCTETADAFMWKLSKFCPDCGAKMKNGGEWDVQKHDQ